MKKTTKKNASKTSAKNGKKDFLVVGLGASAGGVKALQEFFATMPANSGMAFVAILHLSPEHESSLPQILQAQTAMKVRQVTETVKVEPNNVYVIPPNVQLEMVDGVIRPKAAERPTGHRIAIDVFFRTLANAYERNAVCIVLSGTGSDGTSGLKRVKESNGFAIVQDPEDAEYDSMPRSAINTQLADWILPVHQMPEKLLHFRESSERLHLTNGADAKKIAEEINADESLREILTLLRVRTGHDFSNYKTPTLIRRIARHLQIHELEDIPSYLELLRNTPGEIQSLLKNLLINVTNFFRDKTAFESLKSEIIENIFVGKTSKDLVRVWSCGCASGEEAYSLAMLLQEFADTLSDPPRIQIFASDVDEEAIQEAREHRYPESIEADVSPERLKRFFAKEGSFYRVKKELRETVLFAPHNVLRDPPFSRLDLIACRNLLIYLNRETQERVLQIFHFALNTHGYLFLGSSETAENVATLYAPVDKKQRIYSRRTAPLAQTALPMMPVAGRWEVRVPERKPTNLRDRAVTLSDIHYKLLEDYAPSSVLVNQDFDIVYLSGTAGKFLRFSGGEPSRNLLKAINPELLPDLRAALFTAQREHKSSEFPNIRVKIGSEETIINLIVRAVETNDETNDFLLVIFEEKNSPSVVKEADKEIEKITNKDEAMETVVRRLEEDLQRTKEHLRFTIEQHETTVEELKASNEELQAINEELRSASEELETSKEELQSVNEELTTVNHELKENMDESNRTNSDLSNLMAATDIATIFLDKNLQIKRYTPPVEDFFNLTKADIGRPLAHFTHKLNYDDLEGDAARVLKNLAPLEREITDHQNHSFLARFAPYRTLDDRIDGVVLNFIDITGRKQAEEAVAADLRDTQILQSLATRIITEENEQTIYNEILAAAIRITNSDAGTVQTYDAEAKELVLIATNGFKKQMTDYFHRVNASSKTACGVALKTGKQTIVDFDDDLTDKACQMHVEADYHSAQSTPLITRSGKPIGMLNTHWHESKHRPTERELRFLDLLVRQVADLIEQRRADEKLRRAAKSDAFRVELADALRPLADPVDIQESVALTAMKFFKADRCYYCEAVDGKAIIRRDAKRGDLPSVAGEYPLESLPLFKLTMRSGRSLVVEDVRLTDLMDEELKRLCVETQIISFINVPVVKNKEYVGNLCITNDAPRNWSASEVELAEEIAERTWAAIERARAEEALRESEERFRAFVTSSSNVVYSMNADWSEMRFLVGKDLILDTDDTNASWLEKYVPLEDQPEILRHIKKAVKSKSLFELEHRIVQKNKTLGWAHSRAVPVLDAKGKITGWFGTASDITERKEIEENLRQAEERLRIAIEAAELATWIWDLRKNEIVWNERHYTLFGLKPRKKPQSPDLFFEHLHPEDREWVSKRLQKAVKTNTTFSAEFRAVREDGATRWMEGYGHVVETEKNKPLKMSGVMSDITARKNAEIALRESQTRLEILMDSVKDYAIITTDLKGLVVDWNKGAENIFGWKSEEIVGKPADRIFTSEDLADGQPERERQMARKKGRAEDERYHLRKDGSRFYVSGMMTPLKNGELEGYVKIARDQTAKMRAEKDLQEKEMLRRLVAGQENERRRIARDIHDHFGQQLTALRIKLDVLYKENQSQKLNGEIEKAREIAERLDADVDFIAWELRPAALDDLGLRVVLANFVREWSHHAKVAAEFHTANLGKTRLNYEVETNIYRIAQEALNNIYKHAKAKNVSVILEKRKNQVVLIIEDDGIGFNVKNKANRRKGIGLSGMEERAKILGGELEIESEKGAGTTVFARVPVKSAQE